MNLDFTGSDAAELLKKHNIALKLSEALDLQKQLGRPMTLTEATIFGIQLSEHCSYKSSGKFLKTLPTKGPSVILGPAEDSGIVKVFEENGENYAIAVSHESHNHPSQIVPYEGAATGVGGIVRDILCMGARPVGTLDSLRFGDPKKNLQKNIAAVAVEGIAGYGNPLGVPNAGGDVFFDKNFDENCLVNVTAMGVLRESDLIHSYVPQCAAEEKWDLLIVGKPTDNSGFGGASFASDTFEEDDDMESKKAAVQEPNPFLERHLVASFLDLFETLKKEGTFDKFACKDLGAGGVVCATVEIVDSAGFGADVCMDKLHTVGDSPPHVVACSETQERFCVACHPDLTGQILDHFNKKWELGKVAANAGASVVGTVRADGKYIVKYGDEVLCDAPASMVTEGITYDREYEIPKIVEKKTEVTFENGEIVFS
jgi:phosphoribosylformylglycinamidine synthase subunit PurL